jgi:DNA-binding response OmpR family regulator
MNILVIEDDRSTLKALKFALNQKGYKVVLASSEINALNKLKMHDIDCIVSDVHLPGDSEIVSMVKTLKAESGDVPVVLISSNPGNPSIDHSLLSGADAFIPKPINFKLLVDVIERLCSKTAKH